MFARCGVGQQGFHERREEAVKVAFHGGQCPPGDKRCRVFEHPYKLIGQAHHFDTGRVIGRFVRHQKNRHIRPALAQNPQQSLGGFMLGVIIAPNGPIQKDTGNRGIGKHDRFPVLNRCRLNHIHSALAKFARQLGHRASTRRVGCGQFVVNQENAGMQQEIRSLDHGRGGLLFRVGLKIAAKLEAEHERSGGGGSIGSDDILDVGLNKNLLGEIDDITDIKDCFGGGSSAGLLGSGRK
jgi:hypothetical protein